MNSLSFLITIIRRKDTEKYNSFFEKHEIPIVLSSPGRGTAHNKTLDVLGIERSEKMLFFGVADNAKAKKVLSEMKYEMQINAPDHGVALTIPVQSVGGTSVLKYLNGESEVKDNEEKKMIPSSYELIIAITNKGNTEKVMDAARSAGAAGGTVTHAKGVGMKNAEKFLGVSIANEKEIVYIVAHSCDKAEIMKAIIHEAGMKTDAHTVVFSLPVTSAAGFTFCRDEEFSD